MEEIPSNPVKKRISDVIKGRGLKAKLAKMLGFERASISEMLKSPGDPPIHYVKAVSELTGKNMEWLLTGKSPEVFDGAQGNVSEPAAEYLTDKIKMKDELIAELRGKIEDMKKYEAKLEEQLAELKEKVKTKG
jgi:hypothetical protein